MHPSFLLAAFLLLARPVGAQTRPAYPYKTTEYLNEYGQQLPGAEGAHHRIERTFRDSLSGTERVYNAAGKLQEITPYADLIHRVMLGPRTTYYESGELHTKDDYVGAKRNGEFVVYFKNGKVKRRETYHQGERQSGQCFDLEGKSLDCGEYEVMPSYRGGGLQEMVRAVQHQVRYPADALRSQIEGRVYVSFSIGTAGELENVKIVKGLSPSLDLEVVRAVNTLKGFTPGTQDGVPVAVSFTVPITFAIQ